MTLLLVAVGAMVGAPMRYLTDRAVQRRYRGRFPFGTLTVNVAASFILGLLAGAGSRVDGNLETLLGTGLCGALSTYSTFSYETMSLYQQRWRLASVANVAASVIAGIGAAALGWLIGGA